jgi:hypothetical protein
VNRGVALLLALVGGAAVALAAAMGVTVMTMGVLWLFVFGDDRWPGWIEPALDVAIPLLGLAIWAVAALLIWRRLAALRT